MRVAVCLTPGMVIYLTGELGAGKTTFARGILRGLGYPGNVKSPTYSLVELYKFSKLYLYHFDFYRIDDPIELDEAGLREHFGPGSVALVEWPENAAGAVAPADLRVWIRPERDGRRVELRGYTEAGRHCIEQFQYG
jgi:tRNA threonylcarbamoyladenosine biosynthesis protein TsaE